MDMLRNRHKSKMSEIKQRRCFTFIWTVENISYCWQQNNESIDSPTFVINELQDERFQLQLFPRGYGCIRCMILYLNRTNSGERIDCELSLLSKNGSVLLSRFYECRDQTELIVIDEIFEENLIVRCRIWKSVGEMVKNVQCFARTRICIEKNYFLFEVNCFSRSQPEEKHTYQIKSILNNELLVSLDLLTKNRYTDEDRLTLKLVSESPKIRRFVICVSLLNEGGSAYKTIRKELMFLENNEPKLLTLPFSKNDLIENERMWLPNDVLTLRCDCTFATGIILNEIESINYNCDSLQASDLDNQCLDEGNTFSLSKRVLNENLKSLLNDNILSDIKLKTKTKTFLAHKSILSARSPVFKAMFENDMKEKNNASVDIADLDSDTVDRMLRYVYTAEVQDLHLEIACDLYRAADKYEMLTLREECSTFLKSNLCPKSACEVLILADMHQDGDLGAATEDFIFDHDVINSEEWKLLMQTHVALAADTMFSQHQRKARKSSKGKMSSFCSGLAKTSSTLTDKSLTVDSELKSNTSFSSGFDSNVERKTKENSDPLKNPFSFSTPGVPSFTFGNKSTAAVPSFMFDSKCTHAEPSFRFSSKSKPVAPSFTLKTTSTPVVPSFTLSTKSKSVEPSSLYSSKSAPAGPSNPFACKSSTSVEPSFIFSTNSTHVQPSYTSGCNSMLANPSFPFGNGNKDTSVNLIFGLVPKDTRHLQYSQKLSKHL